MDHCTIFYSWQSDVKANRNFISDCMKRLPQKLAVFAAIEISRDTEGIAGAPNIGDTIYEKIDHADIFVADVTIINSDTTGRKTPNPNVLIELGYAIKTLGWNRIILLYDRDFGTVEELPFDINHQRMTGYSLEEESKSQARNTVINHIAATVELLKEQHILHGGQPETVAARRRLTTLLLDALRQVYCFYNRRKTDTDNDYISDSNDFLVITDAQCHDAEIVRPCLTDIQYAALAKLLHQLKLATVGSNDAYGWEVALEAAKGVFDSLYCMYSELMKMIPLEQAFSENFLDIYNALAIDELIPYCAERYADGALVFSNDGHHLEAYASDGHLLCKGEQDEDGFTGYKETRTYIGEFVKSKWHGYGREQIGFFIHHLPAGKDRRVGNWSDGDFAEGTIHSVLFHKAKNGELEPFAGDICGFMTADRIDHSFYHEDDLSSYYLGDAHYDHGDCELIDSSVQPIKTILGYSD